MEKEIGKIMYRIIVTYFIILTIVFVLKMIGLDYFGIDENNEMLNIMNIYMTKYKLDVVWSYVNCYIYYYVMIAVSNKDNSKNMIKYSLVTFPIVIFMQYMKEIIQNSMIEIPLDFLYLYILSLGYNLIANKKDIKGVTKRYLLYTIINLIFQFISVITRYKYTEVGYNFVISFIMNFDYLLLTILFYRIYFMGGGIKCYQMEEVSLFSQKLILLKTLLIKLPKKLRKLTKEQKISWAIYIPLFLFWNFFTLGILLLVAKINGTFVECIFILSAFWINKSIFGKAFHLKSVVSCFIVSNFTYYCLNRITFPISVSFVVPIVLGIMLAYITSKIMCKMSKELYRGMPEKEIRENCMAKGINEIDTNILVDFYSNKYSIVKIARKYNYAEITIKKKKRNIEMIYKRGL